MYLKISVIHHHSFAEEVESDDDDGKTTIETENVLLLPLIDILQHSNTPNSRECLPASIESIRDYL